MGLPSCAVLYLLRNTWSHPSPAEGPEKGSEAYPHGTDRKKSGILPATIMVRQGPLGPALSKTDVDRVEGFVALLPNSLGGMAPAQSVLASASVLKTANSGEPGPRCPQRDVWSQHRSSSDSCKSTLSGTVPCWTVLGLGKLPSQACSSPRPAPWVKPGSTLVCTTTPESTYQTW